MDGDSWGVDIVQALAVPLAVAVALVVLRDPIGDFLRGLGGRISKLSVGRFSVELSAATEIRPPWISEEMFGQRFDVRQLSPADVFDSYADTLLRQLAEPGRLDYVVVDLAAGKSWLTSRLYLFADLLHRMRGLRAFVFVYTVGTKEKSFLGLADAEALRWRLARTHPEFEIQLAQAYSRVLGPLRPGQAPPVVVSDTGALEPWQASNVARQFLAGLQRRNRPAATTGGEWVHLELPPPQEGVWERASWLDAADALTIFEPVLSHAHVVERDDRSIDRTAQVREIVALAGDFVAVVRNERFDRLIDRSSVVEQVAALASSS